MDCRRPRTNHEHLEPKTNNLTSRGIPWQRCSMDTWNPSRLGWLGLASYPNFSSRILHALDTIYKGDGERAWMVPENQLRLLLKRPGSANAFTDFRKKTSLEDIAKKLGAQNIHFTLNTDLQFPLALKHLPHMPKALFFQGSLQGLAAPCLSIVGTRSMTSYGKHACQILATACANAGITIISGLALGIDGEAHRNCLQAQGKTIAILGSGIDKCSLYPRQHAKLAQEIVESGGALMSESGIGYAAMPFDFPLRNRLIAGLSQATLVIEAARKSGSLITAHLAAEQGRDVLAVPGAIHSRQSEGTNTLIKQGAIPCLGIDSILETLHLHHPASPQAPIALEDAERQVLETLTQPKTIDEIAHQLKWPVPQVMSYLSRLEIHGFISKPDGPHFIRAARRF